MIQEGTYLNISDNSGGKLGKCIRVLFKKKNALIGDKIVLSIKTSYKSDKIKEGSVHKALVVRTKRKLFRKDGTIVTFFDNAVILINDEGFPIGTRIFGLIPEEIKKKKYSRIISSVKEFI